MATKCARCGAAEAVFRGVPHADEPQRDARSEDVKHGHNQVWILIRPDQISYLCEGCRREYEREHPLASIQALASEGRRRG